MYGDISDFVKSANFTPFDYNDYMFFWFAVLIDVCAEVRPVSAVRGCTLDTPTSPSPFPQDSPGQKTQVVGVASGQSSKVRDMTFYLLCN